MTRITRRIGIVLTAALLVGAVAVSVALADGSRGSTSAKAPDRNIVETAVASGQFDTLASLLQQAGLAGTLAGEGSFTVFAPTDAAFDRVPDRTLAALGRDPEQLKAVLLYHVAKGKLTARRVVKRTRIKTLNGSSVRIKANRRSVRVNNARISKANVGASNGVIHVINRVLIPPR
jgi:uncharacterized surface protein with fasciclin (FAS1) repeats